MTQLAIIGAGNMGTAIAKGLLNTGWAAENIFASTRSAASLETFRKHCPGVSASRNNIATISECDVVLLCVKPGEIPDVCKEIRASLADQRTTLVSLAAGITLATMSHCLKRDFPIVRCMPNLPVVLGNGVSVLCRNAHVGEDQKSLCKQIFSAVGDVHWIEEESLMDLVTAVSGSGPAYFFRILEALEKAAHALGLERELAHQLVLKTALGSVALAETGDLKTLRAQITSPKGTTEQGIAVLDRQIDELFKNAVQAAAHRAGEISRQYDAEAVTP